MNTATAHANHPSISGLVENELLMMNQKFLLLYLGFFETNKEEVVVKIGVCNDLQKRVSALRSFGYLSIVRVWEVPRSAAFSTETQVKNLAAAKDLISKKVHALPPTETFSIAFMEEVGIPKIQEIVNAEVAVSSKQFVKGRWAETFDKVPPKGLNRSRRSRKNPAQSDGRAASWTLFMKERMSLPDAVAQALAKSDRKLSIEDVIKEVFEVEKIRRPTFLKIRNRVSNILSQGAREDAWIRLGRGFYIRKMSVNSFAQRSPITPTVQLPLIPGG